MARIRTVKPSFYRHEELQALELAQPHLKPMLVFQALWGHCDKSGVFLWKPRTLKLDILPFLPFDLAETLDILVAGGFVEKHTIDGESYGVVPTFLEHQRITGKEAIEASKLPDIRGNNGETTGKHPRRQEGKGREQERKGREQERIRADFDRFWSAYPRKVKKDDTLAEWLKRSPDAELVTVILAALEVHKASPQWTKDGGEFIPHPRTWLHQGRWQDEVKPLQSVDPGPSAEMLKNRQKYADLQPFARGGR